MQNCVPSAKMEHKEFDDSMTDGGSDVTRKRKPVRQSSSYRTKAPIDKSRILLVRDQSAPWMEMAIDFLSETCKDSLFYLLFFPEERNAKFTGKNKTMCPVENQVTPVNGNSRYSSQCTKASSSQLLLYSFSFRSSPFLLIPRFPNNTAPILAAKKP